MKLPEVSFVRIGQIPRLSPPESVEINYYTIQEGGRRMVFVLDGSSIKRLRFNF